MFFHICKLQFLVMHNPAASCVTITTMNGRVPGKTTPRRATALWFLLAFFHAMFAQAIDFESPLAPHDPAEHAPHHVEHEGDDLAASEPEQESECLEDCHCLCLHFALPTEERQGRSASTLTMLATASTCYLPPRMRPDLPPPINA